MVISFLNLSEFSGTETYTITIATQLERLGHEVTVFTVNTGPMTDFARRLGIRIVDRPSRLPAACDAVLAQDAATAYELAARYPDAVRTCTMHAAHHPLVSPPQSEHAYHALLVLNDRI